MAVSAEEMNRRQEAAYRASSPEYRARFDAPRAEPLEGRLDAIWRTLRRVAHGYALLAVLDLRRASIQLAWLIGAGMMIAVLAVTAWLTAVTALVVWLLHGDMPLPLVLLIAAAVNVAGAGALVWKMKDLLTDMPFAATLRQLKGEAAEPEHS